ncbi:hypothetical protein ACIGO9_29705 [Nocardia asteroides]|uniref:hypothetical protein n=1 Tax=Nocardia asteroides TaxID=1824 RepID=UPI0037CCA208
MTPPDAERSRRLISQCNHIARVYDEEYPRFPGADRYRSGGVNPRYNQTTSGLYLEFYYGYPQQLWTPWGTWTFSGLSGSRAGETPEQLNAGFLARVALALHTPQYVVEHFGAFGPIFAVTAVDDDPVEEPGDILRDGPHSGGLGADIAVSEWARHGGQHAPASTV